MNLKMKFAYAAVTIAALATVHCTKKQTLGQTSDSVQITGASSHLATDPGTVTRDSKMPRAQENSVLFQVSLRTRGKISNLDVKKIDYYSCDDSQNCSDDEVFTVGTHLSPPSDSKDAEVNVIDDASDSQALTPGVKQYSFESNANVDRSITSSFQNLEIKPSVSTVIDEELTFRLDSKIYDSFGSTILVVVTTDRGTASFYYKK